MFLIVNTIVDSVSCAIYVSNQMMWTQKEQPIILISETETVSLICVKTKLVSLAFLANIYVKIKIEKPSSLNCKIFIWKISHIIKIKVFQTNRVHEW